MDDQEDDGEKKNVKKDSLHPETNEVKVEKNKKKIHSKIKIKKDKKSVKIQEPLRQDTINQRRRNESEPSTSFQLSIRHKGPQKSHSIRNIVPRLTPEPRNLPNQQNQLRLEFDEPSSSDRDHHAAVEYYNRSTLYSYTRESLINISKPKKKESRSKLHHQHRPKLTHRKFHLHANRCRKCLQRNDECFCESLSEKPPKSDWAVLVQPHIKPSKTWSNSRIDWLEELENKSTVVNENVIDESFDASREFCCCPFKTFHVL